MARAPQVGVIGAGIVGLCAAYALREQGADVRVYESGAPGNGQSGGDSRIFRHSHDDPRLVELTRTSRHIWDEWAERVGVELVSRDGVVALGGAVEERLRVLDGAGGIAARAIGASELRDVLPPLADYDGPAMLDDDGGAIRTRAAIDALARQLRDSLVADEVISLRPVGGAVELRSGGVTAIHESVVVCAGRGTTALARTVGLSLPLSLGAHVRSTFAVRGDPPTRLACLQDSSGEFGEVGTYAAALPGNRRYAVGLSQTVAVQEDGSLVDPAGLASLADRARAYVAKALPGLHPEPLEPRHCWVTDLPWSSDGLAVWEADRILFTCGHNLFKQAPALGRALARAALGDGLPSDLRPEAKLGAKPPA